MARTVVPQGDPSEDGTTGCPNDEASRCHARAVDGSKSRRSDSQGGVPATGPNVSNGSASPGALAPGANPSPPDETFTPVVPNSLNWFQ